jgi:hypothetical protein
VLVKYLLITLLFLVGCSKPDRAIIISAPSPSWMNKMEEFCVTANSEVKDRTITALTHHEFKCYGGFSSGYSCEGYKLQYRVICKNGASQKLTYSFGNMESIITEVKDSKEIEKLSKEKDSL